MQANNDKHSEYLVGRYRQIGTTTTKWALLYFVALLYTWQASIYPRAQLINDYVTTVHREAYFDSLSKKTALNKRRDLQNREKLLYSAKERLQQAEKDTNLIKLYKQQLAFLQNHAKAEKNKNILPRLLSETKNKSRQEKAKNLDSLRQLFTNYDIVLARSQLQKTEAQLQKDSIINKLNISFSIPGLPSVNFGFRIGLIVWMTLLFILLAYQFSERANMIRYLKDIYKINRKQLKSNIEEWEKLDLRSPFWLAPVVISDKNSIPLFKSLLGWRSVSINNAIGVFAFVVMLVVQLQVAWLCWHVSVIRYFESPLLVFLCLLLLAATILVLLLWLRPVNLFPGIFNDQHIDFRRREMIKTGLSASIFLFLVPAIGKRIPLMQGVDLGYRRSKRNRKTAYKVDLANGFYLHKSKYNEVVYYFYQGKTLSMKYINEKQLRKMSKSFKKIELPDILNADPAKPYKLRDWVPAIENEAYQHAIKGEYEQAIRLILLSINYYMPVMSSLLSISIPFTQQSINLSQQSQDLPGLLNIMVPNESLRLIALVRGLIIRAELKSPEDSKKQLQALLQKEFSKLNPAIIKEIDIDVYRQKKSFVKRWTQSKLIPWHLPKDMPWS